MASPDRPIRAARSKMLSTGHPFINVLGTNPSPNVPISNVFGTNPSPKPLAPGFRFAQQQTPDDEEDVERQNQELKAWNRDLKAEGEGIKWQLREREIAIGDLEAKYATLQGTRDELKEKLTAIKTENATLTRQMAKPEEERTQALVQKIEDLKCELGQSMQETEDVESAKEIELDTMQDLKNQADERVERLQDQCLAAQLTVGIRDEEIKKLKEAVVFRSDGEPYTHVEIEKLKEALVFQGDGKTLYTQELYDLDREINAMVDEGGHRFFNREGKVITQTMIVEMEEARDEWIKENQVLKDRTTELSSQLVCDPDGTLVTQENYDANMKTLGDLRQEIFGNTDGQCQNCLDLQGQNIYFEGEMVTQEQFNATHNAALQAPKHANGATVTQQEWDETYPRALHAPKRDDDALVSQQDWDATYPRALNAPKHGDNAMVSQQEWDETYLRAAQAPKHDDDSAVSQQEWSETFTVASQAAKHGDGSAVSQQEWDETFPRAAQAPKHDDGSAVSQQQWDETSTVASQAAKHGNGAVVAQQEWDDAQTTAAQAAKHTDGTTVTLQQWNETQAKASNAATNEDGTLVTIEQVKQLATQNTELQSKLVLESDDLLLTQPRFNEIWDCGTRLTNERDKLLAKAPKETDGSLVTQDKFNELLNALQGLKQTVDDEKSKVANAARETDGSLVTNERFNDLLQTIRELEKAVEDAKSKVANAARETDGSLVTNERFNDLLQTIRDLEKAVEDAKSKVTDMKSIKEEQEQERTRLTKDLTNANAEISKLKAEPRDFAAETQSLKQSLKQATDDNQQKERHIESLQSSNGELEKENDRLKERGKRDAGDLVKQDSKIKSMTRDYEELNTKFEGRVKKVTALQLKVDKQEEQMFAKDEEIKRANKDADRSYEIEGEARNAKEKVLADNKLLQNEVSKLQAVNKDLETEKARARADLGDARREVDGLLKAMDGLRDDAMSSEKKAEALQDENDKLKLEIQKKANPREPSASSPKFNVTNPDGAIRPDEFPARLPLASIVEHGGDGSGDEDNGNEKASDSPRSKSPPVVQDPSHGAGSPGLMPTLPPTAEAPTDGAAEAGGPGIPLTSVAANGNAVGPRSEPPPREGRAPASRMGWKMTLFLFLLLLMFLFFCVSQGVSWWRNAELMGRFDDAARLAMISMDSGGGSGTMWPAWLYDDHVVEIPGGFYG